MAHKRKKKDRTKPWMNMNERLFSKIALPYLDLTVSTFLNISLGESFSYVSVNWKKVPSLRIPAHCIAVLTKRKRSKLGKIWPNKGHNLVSAKYTPHE